MQHATHEDTPPHPDAPAGRGLSRWVLAAAVLVPAATCLVFVLISDHIWEDYLITFRASRNLVLGHGPVYVPGEHVHSFTSFLNTFLPALYDWVLTGGKGSIYPALWVYRITCILVLGAASAIMALHFYRDRPADRVTPLLFVGLLALEIKTVSFTTNGQEVAFMALFVACALVLCWRGVARHWLLLGFAGAGLLYTRPDGFVYASIIGVACILFGTHRRIPEWIGLAKAAGVTVLLYLPWALWVWWFYGSPVPNTISAKRGAYVDPMTWDNPARSIKAILGHQIDVFSQAFEGVYSSVAGWPLWIDQVMLVLGLFAAFVWVMPTRDRLARSASFAFFLMSFYLAYLWRNCGILFPWYLPATAFLGLVVLARGPAMLLELNWANAESRRALRSLLSLGLVGVFLGVYVLGTIQLTSQQALVEEKVRKQIGLWFAEHMEPGQTIHLEPIGYIGFYSNAKLYDWPGLTSLEMVESRKRNNNDRAAVINDLQPDWLVLRPGEYKQLFADPQFRAGYTFVKEFSSIEELDALGWVPGKGYHYTDARFAIFQRNPAATPDAAPAPPTPAGR